jgi:hypothetical protein
MVEVSLLSRPGIPTIFQSMTRATRNKYFIGAFAKSDDETPGQIKIPLLRIIPGADDGTRTRDPHLGKVMRYQLRYVRTLS